MKVIGIIINIFFPGVGTLIVGKIGTGVIQTLLSVIAGVLIFTGFFSIIGTPLLIIVWIWSLISVVGSKNTETIIVKEVIREVPVEKEEK
jgi:TM2 domain-containing membrane protein YozV